MSMPIHYNECPVCASSVILPTLSAKDNTVSSEVFEIWQCNRCLARFTQDAPDEMDSGRYYQSDSYVSHTETREGLVNKLYHIVRNYTLGQKQKMVVKTSRQDNGKLLDVGAGTGAFASTMQKKGWTVTGLEPDNTARENAKNNHGIVLGAPEQLFTLPPTSFDVITLWHVLEHVHELHPYIDAFHTILKPGGKLIIAVPNYTSKDAKKYRENWAAYDVPRHLYHFSPQSMQHLMHQHKFSIIKYKPMWFDSFYVSLLSEQYKSGKKNLIKALWNGFRSNINAFNNVKACSSIIYIMGKEVKEKES